MTSTLTREEHAKLARTLTDWGVDPDLITDTLADAAFGPGVIGWTEENQAVGAGVGILVDESRDPELAAVFDERRQTPEDHDFLAGFEASPTCVWAILCPHAPEALVAIGITLARPSQVRRTFLLLASKQAGVLALLAQPGAIVWLVPHRVAIREWAKEGTGTPYDLWAESLPLGQITEPMPAVELALRHVGHNVGATSHSP